MCAKLSVSIPHLHPRPFTHDRQQIAFGTGIKEQPTTDPYLASQQLNSVETKVPLRRQAAAPPTYLILLVAVPIAAASYITASRWFDNRHSGFDLIFGSLLGLLFAWFGFRLYHPPLSFGGGWAWGPRDKELAFFSGVGFANYVNDEGSSTARYVNTSNGMVNRPGIDWTGTYQRQPGVVNGIAEA